MIAGNEPRYVCPGPCSRCGGYTQNYGMCNVCLGKPDKPEPDEEQARAIRLEAWAKHRAKRAARAF